MMPSEYCAYNVVIPALKPYDEKKYSQRLRDEFTWTKPTYFEIPMFDTDYNKDDHKKIYDFISRIRNLSKYGLPNTIREYLASIERVCVCLYHLILSGNNSDIQMIIHTLNLINTCYKYIKNQSIDKIIEDGKKGNDFLSEADFESACLQLKDISTEFLVEDRKNNNIAAIIDRYRNTVWNDFHQESFIDIGYRKGENIQSIEKWCHDNHLLYFRHILSEDDAVLVGKPIKEVITPLVLRRNSCSIYDIVEQVPIDYVKEGFDSLEHGMEIVK